MSEKNKIEVRIGDNEYTLVAAESEEYMHKVASLVDKKMLAICQVDDRLSTSMMAVLAAINMADDYLKLKEREEKLVAQVVEYTKEIERLTAQVEKKQPPSN